VPSYCFRCKACGAKFEEVHSITAAPTKARCLCGADAGRDWKAEVAGGVLDSQMREYDFDGECGCRMYPAGYLPNQAAEAHAKHPGTDFRVCNGTLLPVIRNRRHKLKYLKEHGFVELD